MATVVERLEDEVYDHVIQINRFEEGLKRRTIGFLREMADDINSLLSDAPPAMAGSRLKELLNQIDMIIEESHKKAKDDLRGQLINFAKVEEKSVIEQTNNAIKTNIFTTTLTQTQLQAIVDDGLIRGAVASEWWDRLEKNTKNRIVKGIQLGLAEGESIEEIKDRLLGKRTGNFETYVIDEKVKRRYERRGGWIDMSDREAESLIRTSVHKVSSSVRDKTYDDNLDVIDAVESVATLDGRTTPICASYDGLRWTADGHEPIGGHGKVYLATPRHWNCRSTHVPVLGELDKLDAMAKTKGIKIPPAIRASIDGPQRQTMNMEKWLKKQSHERQNKMIGSKQKADLFREGKLKLKDFTGRRGDPLTIEQLERKAN